MFSSTGGSGGSRPSASVPPSRSNSGGDGPNGYRTPKYKKTNSESTPDTAAMATPSSDRCADGENAAARKQRRSRNKRGADPPRSSPRSSPRGSPRSTPRNSPRSSPRTSPRGSLRTSPLNSFANIFVLDTSNDEAVARRLEQELRDAELASTLAGAEHASADFAVDGIPVGNIAALPSRGDSFAESPPPQRAQQPPEDCRGKAVYYSIRIAVAVLATGIAFVIFIALFGRQTSDSLDPASWLPGYPEMDPSLGSVGEHNVWRPIDGGAGGYGLSLTVLNNLVSGSDWNEYLATSISDWDGGTPDAVTLNIRSMAHDPDCRAVRRAMKVCNANYGPTDWRGVNQILLQDDFILTSLAKMNDYYLEGTNRAQKQYTMCHELGHGLGLGHSDENFHNEDLGNCMDYTERPQNNMHPDATNFRTLEELYGSVNGNVLVERLEVTGAPGERRTSKEEDRMQEDEFETYAAYLLGPIEVSSEMMAGGDDPGPWRLLRRTDTAELHERRLGNGYLIRTSVLLA